MATQITSQATITYQSGKTSQTATSNIATSTLEGPFSVAKTSLGETYSSFGDVTYILTTTNHGAITLTNVCIEDDLGRGENKVAPLSYQGPAQLYLNGILDNSLIVNQKTDQLIFTIPSLAPKTTAIIVYKAKPNQYAPAAVNGKITNKASWTADLVAEPTMDSNSITVESQANVAIVKSMSPDPVTAGSTLTYTFNMTNTGNISADNVVLTDTFNPAPVNITVVLNGHVLPNTDYTYQDGTLTINNGLSIPSATYLTAPDGTLTTIPGTALITVTGTI